MNTWDDNSERPRSESKRCLILLLNSARKVKVRPKVTTPNQQVKEKPQKGQDMKEDQLTIRMALELISRSSKASQSQKNSLIGLALKQFLSTRRDSEPKNEVSCFQTSKVCLFMVDKSLCQKNEKSKGEDSNLGEDERQIKVPVLTILLHWR